MVRLRSGRYPGARPYPCNVPQPLRALARVERVGPLSSSASTYMGLAVATTSCAPVHPHVLERLFRMGSVVKKRRKRMAKKKHRKLLRKTRVQRRRLGK